MRDAAVNPSHTHAQSGSYTTVDGRDSGGQMDSRDYYIFNLFLLLIFILFIFFVERSKGSAVLHELFLLASASLLLLARGGEQVVQ
jgi:hypothetical protein